MDVILFPSSTTDSEALTIALTTAISSPQDFEFLDTLIATAERYAAGLDATTVRECKTAALKQAERLSSFQDRRGRHTDAPSLQEQERRMRTVYAKRA